MQIAHLEKDAEALETVAIQRIYIWRHSEISVSSLRTPRDSVLKAVCVTSGLAQPLLSVVCPRPAAMQIALSGGVGSITEHA